MKKDIKGFTLVELLAVITVLGIVMAIGTISVTDLINRSKEKTYNEQINAIELAAKTFATKHTEILDEESTINYILIEELKKDGLLENIDIIDPRNGKEIEGCINVIYNKDNNKYEYNFTEKCKYTEKLLNGADPKLSKELIPVIISDNGTVTKADVTEKWYSYEEKKWANAVILINDTKKYSNGDTIPESNIESYFVWIPRYSYKLFNLGNYNGTISGKPTENNAKIIDIKFGTNTTKDSNTGECTTPMLSGETGNCELGEYMTHPAFITFNTNGIWVGKFDTTGTISNITIKPNIGQLRGQNIKNLFESLYNYNRKINSHMIKNTEWGAVAYLTYSKYGGNQKINVNNHYSTSLWFKTGYSATEESNQTIWQSVVGTTSDLTLPYNTETGYKASTTNNISGIYDIAGGIIEYVAGYIDGDYSSSGFNNESISLYSKKYFDIYKSDSHHESFNNRILGDATGEIGPYYKYTDANGYERKVDTWYGEIAIFPFKENSWIYRGGSYNDGIYAGMYMYYRTPGHANNSAGSRMILAF